VNALTLRKQPAGCVRRRARYPSPPLAESAPAPAAGPVTPLQAIDALRRIRSRLGEDDHDAAWFTACLARYERFAEHGETFDRSFGLAAPGKDSWWRAETRERRDDAMRRLHALGLTAPQISAAIIARRRRRIAQPSLSEQDRLLDAIGASDAPTSEKQIRRIIMNLHDNFGT
jgi:hypothetical protein